MAKIYYINLDSRPDRDKEVISELEKTGLEFQRVAAEKANTAAAGCTKSHIKALKLAYEEGHEDVIICEDDIVFETDPKFVLNYVGREYNVILLSYHVPVVRLKNFDNGWADVENGQTTAMYMVKRDYIRTMLINFEKSLGKLTQTKQHKKYALDQYWKSLQTNFKAAIPRVSKQKDSYSDIEKKDVSYNGFFGMGILSCDRYQERRENQDLTNCPFIHHYFAGKNSPGCILLPCEDGYEDLTQKTKEMLKWWLNEYPHLDYIFKTDDDVSFNFEKLHELAVKVCYRKQDYAGYTVDIKRPHMSSYHKGRTNKKLPEVRMLPCQYCAGGGYFLSRKAAELVVDNIDKHGNIYEDYSVGYTLNKLNIYPESIDIKKACFWS